ncbi:cytochrome P450 [Tanacetum coccineum]
MGKVCVLTKLPNFIHETIYVPIDNEVLPIPDTEIDGEVDSFFNGYACESSEGNTVIGDLNGWQNEGVNEMVDIQQSDDENSTDGGDKESSGEFDAVSGENTVHDTNEAVSPLRIQQMGLEVLYLGCSEDGSTSTFAEVKDKDSNMVSDKAPDNNLGCIRTGSTSKGANEMVDTQQSDDENSTDGGDKEILREFDSRSTSTFAEIKDKDSNIVSDKAPDNNLGCIRIGSTSKGILRCNTRILSQPTASNNPESNEVNNTINVGNLVVFSMNGIGEDHKRSWVKRLCIENKVKFVGLQETMSRDDNKFLNHYGKIPSLPTSPKKQMENRVALSLFGTLYFFPHLQLLRGTGLWKSQNIPSIVFGDFNEVRNASERLGSIFDATGASVFNKFIFTSGLCDLPIGGKRFTRMDIIGSKLSKIDRILVSKHFVDLWPYSYVTALTREFSDHTPLLLSNSIIDYGPTPFKLYNSWISHIDFRPLVLRCWAPYVVHSTVHPAVSFKSKLQHLKSSIKKWRSDIQCIESAAAVKLRGKLDDLDNKAEVGPLTPTDATARIDIVRELTSLERIKVMDLRQ